MKITNYSLVDTLEQVSTDHLAEVHGPLKCHQLCSFCKRRLVVPQERLENSKALLNPQPEPQLLGHEAAGLNKCKHSQGSDSWKRKQTERCCSNCCRMHIRTTPTYQVKQHSQCSSTCKSSTISWSRFRLQPFFLCTLLLLLLSSHASAHLPQTTTPKSHKHPSWSLLNIETVNSQQIGQTMLHRSSDSESLRSGIPDLVARAGRLFRYRIPDDSFSGAVSQYQVHKTHASIYRPMHIHYT